MMTGALKVFISYSHDTVEHQERVLGFADRLRADGIDAEIDQYNAAPSEGWPLWCERQIAAADVVLMVCTETYNRRVRGDEKQGKGLGVVWEARIIRQLLYDAGTASDKFVPVLFSDASPEQIPTPIKSWTRYVVDTEDGYEELYRHLTGQPRLLRPALGTIRPMPTRRRQWSEGSMEAASSSLNSREMAERKGSEVIVMTGADPADPVDTLSKARLDALSAIHSHSRRIRKYQLRNLLIEFLSIAVPSFYLVPRYLLKGTVAQQYVDIVGELLAAILFILVIMKVVFKWQDRELRHLVMSRKNADIAHEANQLIGRETIGRDVIDQFLKRVSDIDSEDRDLLGDATKKEDQEAYRMALKELVPGETKKCKCGADPDQFKPGHCDICGGTPVLS